MVGEDPEPVGTGWDEAMFVAMYDVEWSPNATTSLHKECETGCISSSVRVASIIRFPTVSIHIMRGSVNVFVPEPSDNGDLVVTSCNASDAAIKIELSGNFGSSNDIRRGMRGVRWLRNVSLGCRSRDSERPYSVFKKDIHACKHRSADRY